MPTLASVCPLDCPDRCSLDVTVEDGKIQRIAGSHRHALTAGYICSKVANFDRRVYGPERVLHPAVRVGPKGPGARFERVSWDEALDLVAERWKAILAEHGGEALLPYWYAGSNGYLTGGGLDAQLWAKLGTTRIERTLCAANAGAAVRAVYGDLGSSDPADIAHAQVGVLWGMNPHASGIHLVGQIKQLLDAGGQLLLVDPRATKFASRAAVHLRPLPGTDVAIALALLHLAFAEGWADRAFLQTWSDDAEALEAWVKPWTPARAAALCDVPEADIRRFAELYAAASPAFVRCGWGVERSRNGTDAIRAILSLPAVYGKFGQRGGGYAMSTSGGYRVDKRQLEVPHTGRVLNMSQLGRDLLERRDPPIRSVYVYDCNPVATVPDQNRVIAGLQREDLFTVVHEQVWNDTTDYADVVLPATTFLEHTELSRGYGAYVMQWSPPVIAPVGESRANHEVFADLGRRLGIALTDTEDDLAQRVLNALPAPIPLDRIKQTRAEAVPAPVQFVDTTTRIRLVGDAPPDYKPAPVDRERSFILISPASTRGISSTLFETLPPGEATVCVHPEDIVEAGLTPGAAARVWNSVGEAVLKVEADPTLRRGVVMIPKGLWGRSTLNGRTANALVPDHLDEAGGGACYNDARVDLSPG